jgi:hypothetical protein
VLICARAGRLAAGFSFGAPHEETQAPPEAE